MWVFALDLETTGLSTADDRIVQIGIAAMHSDGESVGWSSLVNPQGHPISPSASAVNGLTDEDVRLAPAFPRVWLDVTKFVFERAQNSVSYVLTWNGWGYDWPLLFAEFARYGIQPVAALGIVGFILFSAAFEQLPPRYYLNGSIAYVPCLLVLSLMAFCLRRRNPQAAAFQARAAAMRACIFVSHPSHDTSADRSFSRRI